MQNVLLVIKRETGTALDGSLITNSELHHFYFSYCCNFGVFFFIIGRCVAVKGAKSFENMISLIVVENFENLTPILE